MALALDLGCTSLSVIAFGGALLRSARGLGAVDVMVTGGQGVGIVGLGDKTTVKRILG